jgi:hypothetical protein
MTCPLPSATLLPAQGRKRRHGKGSFLDAALACRSEREVSPRKFRLNRHPHLAASRAFRSLIGRWLDAGQVVG